MKFSISAIMLCVVLFAIGITVGRITRAPKTVRFLNIEQNLVHADKVKVTNLFGGAQTAYVSDREFVKEVALWTNGKVSELPEAGDIGTALPTFEIRFAFGNGGVITYEFYEGRSIMTKKAFHSAEDIALLEKWVRTCSR